MTINNKLAKKTPRGGGGLRLRATAASETPRKFTLYDVRNLDDQLRRPSELYDVFWDVEEPKGS